MRWILIAFGVFDGYLFLRHAGRTFGIFSEQLYRLQHLGEIQFHPFFHLYATGAIILFATLPLTAFGVPFHKKWAFSVSYFQLPLRFAYATYTFGFLYLLFPFLPEGMPSKSWFVTGLAGLLEFVRLGITVVAHRHLRCGGTVRAHISLGRSFKIGIGVAGLLLLLVAGIGSWYDLTGRLYPSMQSALLFDDLPAVKLILSREPGQLNTLDAHGVAPLHIAIGLGKVTKNPASAVYLLEQGADPNILDDWHNTPLHEAAGNVALTQILIEHGADPTRRNKSGELPLHRAMAGTVDAVGLLLKLAPGTVNAIDSAGKTPLHYAGTKAETVQFLIAHGADVNAKTDTGTTALHSICAFGNAHAAKLLIEAGASFDDRDASGETALYKAAWFGNLEIVKMLLNAGAKADGWTHDATDALMAALENHPFEQEMHATICEDRDSIVSLILAKDITKLYVDKDFKRLFKYARTHQERCKNSKVIDLLRQHGLKEPME